MERSEPIKQPNQKIYQRKLYAIVYFLSFITLGISTATLGPMLPQLAGSLNTTIGAISILISAKSIGYLLGSIGGGRLYDRFKGHYLIAIAISFMALIMIMIPLLRSFVILAILMATLGLLEGFLDVGGNTLTLWSFRTNVAPYMNALHFSFGLGAFIAPLIIANLMQFNDALRWTYWLLAILFIPSIIGFIYLPSPEPVITIKSDQKNIQNIPIAGLIVLLFFMYVAGENSYGNWLFTYASQSNLTTDIMAAYLTSAFWGSFTFGRLIGIAMVKWLKPAKILIIDMVGSVIALAIILVWSTNVALLWLATITLGLFMASVFPTLFVFAEKRFQITGGLTSMFFAGAGLGTIIVPFIISKLFDQLGVTIIPTTIFIVMTIGTIILLLLLQRSKKIHNN